MIAAGGAYSDTVTINAGTARRHHGQRDRAQRRRPGRHRHRRHRRAPPPSSSPPTPAPRPASGWPAAARSARSPAPARPWRAAQQLKLTLFSASAVLQPGQTLVTFGSVGGRPYVPGVPVGTVTQVTTQPGALTQTALVTAVRRLHRPRRGRRGGQQVSVSAAIAAAGAHGHHRVAAALLRRRRPPAHRGQPAAAARRRRPGPGAAGSSPRSPSAPARWPACWPGFAGGLALDIAPPATHYAGRVRAGLLPGRVRLRPGRATRSPTRRASRPMVTSLDRHGGRGVAAGEAGKAALGMMLSRPGRDQPRDQPVLPVAIVYDLLLCPFAYWLISLVLRRPAPERAPRPDSPAGRDRVPGRVRGGARGGPARCGWPAGDSGRRPVPRPARSQSCGSHAGRPSSLSGTYGRILPGAAARQRPGP